jgi:hypothetical protein
MFSVCCVAGREESLADIQGVSIGNRGSLRTHVAGKGALELQLQCSTSKSAMVENKSPSRMLE